MDTGPTQLDPKYLYLGPRLADTGTTATTVTADCTTYSLPCAGLSNFVTSQPLSTLLKPFPFQTVPDSFGYIGNANYHALQVMANLRSWHGLTVNANYAFSRAIDDGGTFRSGYALPAGTIANHPNFSFSADSIERGVSTSNQPQHLVVTTVWAWPLGKTVLADNFTERAILGGFKFSGIYQAYSGSPLAITASACQTNPSLAQSTSSCAPTRNPNFSGRARQGGKWGRGVTWANYNDPDEFRLLLHRPQHRHYPEHHFRAVRQPCLDGAEHHRCARLHLRRCSAHRSLQPLRPWQLPARSRHGAHLPPAHH